MSFLHRLKSRKLLIASIGVATVSYMGCGLGETNTGNLIVPPCEYDNSCNTTTATGAGGGTSSSTADSSSSSSTSGAGGAGGRGGAGPEDAGTDGS